MPGLTLPHPPSDTVTIGPSSIKSFNAPKITPAPRWAPEDIIEGGVNTYKPFRDIPAPIICNLQNPWRLTLANSATISWNYRDPKPSRSLPICEAAHRPYQIYVDKVVKVPMWYNHFHIAVRSNQFENHRARAELLVKSIDTWGPNEINPLVYSFIGRACVTETGGVASFAQQVCYHFENQRPSAYEQFRDGFVRILLGTFLACWDQNCEWSMIRNPSDMTTYLPASRRLAVFIGETMKYGILTASDVRPCVRLLLNQAYYLEYVGAVHDILKHAGDVFWKGSFDREQGVGGFVLRLNEDVDVVIREGECLQRDARDLDERRGEARWLYEAIMKIVDRYGRTN